MTNLITLLKLKREKVPPERIRTYLIEGGDELTLKELERLAATESFEALVAELSTYSFYEDLKEALEKAKESGSLNDVSLAAKKHLMSRAERFSRLYPLSVLPIIDFMIRKKTEVDNIRIIARCKESGLDPETTKRLLVT
jgi:V/A-type H+-transporting ATPase subunit C